MLAPDGSSPAPVPASASTRRSTRHRSRTRRTRRSAACAPRRAGSGGAAGRPARSPIMVGGEPTRSRRAAGARAARRPRRAPRPGRGRHRGQAGPQPACTSSRSPRPIEALALAEAAGIDLRHARQDRAAHRRDDRRAGRDHVARRTGPVAHRRPVASDPRARRARSARRTCARGRARRPAGRRHPAGRSRARPGLAARPRESHVSDDRGRRPQRRGLAKMNEVYGWESGDYPGDFFAITRDHLFAEIWTRARPRHRAAPVDADRDARRERPHDILEIQLDAGLPARRTGRGSSCARSSSSSRTTPAGPPPPRSTDRSRSCIAKTRAKDGDRERRAGWSST